MIIFGLSLVLEVGTGQVLYREGGGSGVESVPDTEPLDETP